MKTIPNLSAMLLFAVPLLAACGPQEEPRQPPDKVAVQLKWVHQAQFAGFYIAQEKGYYAAENIAATFFEGGPGIDNIEKVVTGGADFGVDASMGNSPASQPTTSSKTGWHAWVRQWRTH